MKINNLMTVAELIMAQEIEKFKVRIEKILDDLYCEFKSQAESEVIEQILQDAAKDRFEEFYPNEPFFNSVFNKAAARYELDLRFDDAEESDDNFKYIQKMKNGRRVE